MPAAGGPNTLGESNLVFAYDTGDVSNSYIGEPTVNLHPYSIDVSNWTGDLFGNWISSIVTSDAVIAPDKTLTGDILGNGYGRFNSSTTIAPSQIYTYTVYLKNISLTNDFGIFYSYGLNGGLVSYGQGISVSIASLSTTEWTRFTLTTAAPSSGVNQVQLGPCPFTGYGNPSGQQIAVWGGMIELKNHATPFVNGTRSATQGLLPLIGTSTIDLTNVSFDSNAQIEFDGTNDFIDTNFPATTLNTPTIEAVVYRSTATGRYEAIVQSNLASDDALYVYPGGTLGFWPCSVSSLPVPTGQWSYVAVSYNGTNLTYCVNGVTETITATCTDITDWDFLRIGAHGVSDGERWIGKIAVSKVYDRALTAQEIKQNYQQYKTRFNLS